MVLLVEQRLRLLLRQPVQLGPCQVAKLAAVSAHQVHLHLLQIDKRHFTQHILVELIHNAINDLAVNPVVGAALLQVGVGEHQVQTARILIDDPDNLQQRITQNTRTFCLQTGYRVVFWHIAPRLVSKGNNVGHDALLGAMSVIPLRRVSYNYVYIGKRT